MLHQSLLSAFVVLSSSFVQARSLSNFTVRPIYKPVPNREASPNTVTDNVVSLTRSNATSASSEYLAAIRAGNQVDGVYSRLKTGNVSLLSFASGTVILAPIAIGGQSFDVVVDTGSSDTWVVEGNFTCLNPATSTEQTQADCNFGPTYIVSSTANVIPNRNFNISYADGEYLNGAMITENITFANISVSQQEMAVVDYAAWYGDGSSSGLVGLAYSSLTHAYTGDSPAADDDESNTPYSMLFTTMYTTDLTSSVFALALQRPTSDTSTAGGILALGGIPNIKHDSTFVSAPIGVVGIDSTTGDAEYEYYSIAIGGWAYSNSTAAVFDVSNTGSKRYTPIVTETADVIVDSGTSLVYAPAAVAEGVAALFEPAGVFNEDYGLYTVDCDATGPVFGIVVSKKVLYVNPVDLVLDVGGGVCVSGVQSDGGGLRILGDVFLRNVLAVFDVGAAEIRFAAREFYSAAQ